MRSARLAVLALAAAALTACSNDLTGPGATEPSGTPLKTGYILITGSKAPVANTTESCRSGYMLSSGRCEDATISAAGGATIGTQSTCRTGYILIGGRCVEEPQ